MFAFTAYKFFDVIIHTGSIYLTVFECFDSAKCGTIFRRYARDADL